jgi:tetratricopeptide (TPR) repeat protein
MEPSSGCAIHEEAMTIAVPKAGHLAEVPLPVLFRGLQHDLATGILTISRNDQIKQVYFKQGDMVFASSNYENDRLGVILLKEGRINFTQYENSSRLLKETKKRQGTILVEQGLLTPKELYQAVNSQVKEIILGFFTWWDGDYRFEEQKLPTDEVIPLRIGTGALIYEGIRRISDYARFCHLLPPFDAVLCIGTDPLDLFQAVSITSEERRLLLLINGVRTVRDLLNAMVLPFLHTIQLLYFLLSIGIIRVKTAEVSGGKAQSTQLYQLELEAFVTESVKLKDEEGAEVSQGGLFDLVGVEEVDTSPSAITLAYEAMEDKDDYDMLEVKRGAPLMEIRKSYFRMAKAYHPDRHYETGMEAAHPMLVALFSRLTQSYQSLSDEPSPTMAMGAQQPSMAGMMSADSASETDLAKQGEAALLAGNLKEAISRLERAIKQDEENARAHALLGQTLANVPNRRKDAESELRRAIELDSSNPDYHVILGLFYIQMNQPGKALIQFEETLRWEPGNAKAIEQLKLLGRR